VGYAELGEPIIGSKIDHVTNNLYIDYQTVLITSFISSLTHFLVVMSTADLATTRQVNKSRACLGREDIAKN
jgi:hypothetical protein